jgi:hypothetical protein
LTTPDTRFVTAVITCGTGLGVGSGVIAELCIALDSVCVVTFRSGAATVVRSGTRLARLSAASVVASCVAVADAVASCSASTTVDTGAGVFLFRRLGATGSDPFDVRGLPVGPSSAAVPGGVAASLGGVLVVDAGAFSVRPPPDFVVPCAPLVLVVAGSVSEAVLEAVDPAVPPDSSAHARPLLHPVTTAAPTPKATARPPTRLTNASRGMRYV